MENQLVRKKWVLWYFCRFHSLHHTQFRTNYSLIMAFYDYIYGTTDKASDTLQESALKWEEETLDVVHLTHLTTSQSIYHLRLGFAYLASKPYTSKWYLWLMWPMTAWFMILTHMDQWYNIHCGGKSFWYIQAANLEIPKYSLQLSFLFFHSLYLFSVFASSIS